MSSATFLFVVSFGINWSYRTWITFIQIFIEIKVIFSGKMPI